MHVPVLEEDTGQPREIDRAVWHDALSGARQARRAVVGELPIEVQAPVGARATGPILEPDDGRRQRRQRSAVRVGHPGTEPPVVGLWGLALEGAEHEAVWLDDDDALVERAPGQGDDGEP